MKGDVSVLIPLKHIQLKFSVNKSQAMQAIVAGDLEFGMRFESTSSGRIIISKKLKTSKS
jgi:hypothetical protein